MPSRYGRERLGSRSEPWRTPLGSSRPTGDSDAARIASIGSGDLRVLERLYAEQGALVHGLALRILHHAAEAEEVVQEVFLYVWQQAGRYDPGRGSVEAWLVTLARSRSIDRLRAGASRERRHAGLARDSDSVHGASPPPDPLRETLSHEARSRVQRALAALPAEQRRALEIAYFEGCSHSEIASRLGAPLGTVKTRIRQGMLRLRDLLADEEGAAS